MGYIIEPKGIDLIVAPSELTDENAKAFSAAITYYKQTGKTPVAQPSKLTAKLTDSKSARSSKVARQ